MCPGNPHEGVGRSVLLERGKNKIEQGISTLLKHRKMETQIRFLGQEDPLEKEMETHSSTLAWRIPWTEEPGGLQSVGSQRVGHELETKQQQQ